MWWLQKFNWRHSNESKSRSIQRATHAVIEAMECRTMLSVAGSIYMERLAFLHDPHNGHGMTGFISKFNHDADAQTVGRRMNVDLSAAAIGSASAEAIQPESHTTINSRKVDSALSHLYDEYLAFLAHGGHGTFGSLQPNVVLNGDRVSIEAVANSVPTISTAQARDRLASDLRAIGMVELFDDVGGGVQGQLPITSIELLPDLASLVSARLESIAVLGNAGQSAIGVTTIADDYSDPLGLLQLKSGPLQKLSTELAVTYQEYSAAKTSPDNGTEFRPKFASALPVIDGMVPVVAIPEGDNLLALRKDLESLGMQNVYEGRTIEGMLPLGALSKAAALDTLLTMRAEYANAAAGDRKRGQDSFN